MMPLPWLLAFGYNGPVSYWATCVVALAVFYASGALTYAVLYLTDRAEPRTLLLASVSACCAVFSVGTAVGIDQTGVQAAHAASYLMLTSAAIGLPLALDFASRTTHSRSTFAVLAGYLLAGVTLTASAFDLPFDEALRYQMGTSMPWPFELTLLRPTRLGQALILLTIPLSLSSTTFMLRRRAAGGVKEYWLVSPAIVLSGLATPHDILMLAGLVDGIPLVPFTSVPLMISMSYLLQGRFARADAELAIRTDQLHAGYEELRETQAELLRREQLAAVGELSAVIAHEARNPLSIIRNAASSLDKPEIDAESRDTLLDILDDEVNRLNRLVTDLLAYAKPITLQTQEVDISALLNKAMGLALAAQTRSRSVSHEIEISDPPEEFHADPNLLCQAVVNVLENAIQAMPTGGTLSIKVSADTINDEPAVCLKIADTGEGMDTIVRNKARDAFFTTRPAGTGLGLAIVDRVVRLHQGQLGIRSRHGAGTTVALKLPVTPSTAVPIPTLEEVQGFRAAATARSERNRA